MLTIEEVKSRLSDRNLKEVSRRTGISYANLYAIGTGRRKNPTYRVIAKLSDYLEQKNDQ